MTLLKDALIKLGTHNKALRPHIRAILAARAVDPKEDIRKLKKGIQDVEKIYRPHQKEAKVVLDGLNRIKRLLSTVESDLKPYTGEKGGRTDWALSRKGAEALYDIREILEDIAYKAEDEVWEAILEETPPGSAGDKVMDKATQAFLILDKDLRRLNIIARDVHRDGDYYFWYLGTGAGRSF